MVVTKITLYKASSPINFLNTDRFRKELPDKVRVVYVSPDSVLWRVPWAALPGDKPKSILLEDYAIAVIPHAVFLLDKLWPPDVAKNPPTTGRADGSQGIRPNRLKMVVGSGADRSLIQP